jgi:CubicO group peptidase (beta-lactamase class C family)
MKKLVVGIFILIVGLIVLPLLWAFLTYPADYVWRALRWGTSDVFDYQKFPERFMSKGESTFQFTTALDEARVQELFAQHPSIDDLDTFLEETRTQAFIVIQDDQILYEKYFNGNDRDSIVTSFSTAKSFTSALIGLAIADGFINSVNDPITDYLPELAERDPAFAQITIRDLLMMSSGIHYEEFPFFSGDDVKTYYYPDLRDLALNQTEIEGSPGDGFLYNNYHPLLLGTILERATGKPVADYLAEKLWRPLGMAYDGSWSLDETGFEKMESGINARAIDFAMFGRLYLIEGYWDGTQIIPADWVEESTKMDPNVPESYYSPEFRKSLPNGYYKYMWWGLQRGEQDYDFSALGHHGQFIYISPHKQLIIVRHGIKDGVEYPEWFDIFYEFARNIEAPTS